MGSNTTIAEPHRAGPRQWGQFHAGALTPALQDLMRIFIPTGSRCLDMSRGDRWPLQSWLIEHGCTYVRADWSKAPVLPFQDGVFGAAVAVDVVHRLSEPGRAAEELRRILQPGGVLLVVVPNAGYWRRRLGRTVRDHDRSVPGFGPASLKCMLLKAGFALVGVEGQDGGPSAAYRFAERLLPSLLGSSLGAFAIRS